MGSGCLGHIEDFRNIWEPNMDPKNLIFLIMGTSPKRYIPLILGSPGSLPIFEVVCHVDRLHVAVRRL